MNFPPAALVHLALASTLALSAADGKDSQPLVLQPPSPNDTLVLSNLVYQASGRRKLDAYLPARLAEREARPAVVFVHGDAAPESLNSPKDWRCFRDYGHLAAAEGMVGVIFNYRSSEEGRQLAEADLDVLDALRYVRSEADQLHIDPERLGLWFFSGGGSHIALTLRTNLPGVKAVAGYYPVLFPDPRFLVPEQWRRFGAAYHLSGDSAMAPPLLLVRCGFDSPFINQPLDNFVHEAVTKNFALELVNLPTAPHAFDVLHDTPETKAVIRRTFGWFRDKLK